jgi:hypothetical protein
MQKILFLLLACLFTQVVIGQIQDSISDSTVRVDSSLLSLEMELNQLGETLLNDSLLINRQNANHKFSILLEQALQEPSAYANAFDSLYTVSKLRSADDSFRIFTWQLFEKDDVYTYMGYILKADGTLIKLNDASSDYFTPEFETGDKDHWYGALYYSMTPFQVKDKTMYLVFGFDGNSLMENRKIIDVLSFDEAGNPIFGADVFVPGEQSTSHPASMSRVILEYFAGAKISCNYDEIQQQVLYDHLIFKKTQFGQFLIPDGSYEGYVYDKGKWRHNVKVFHQTQEAPPFPAPKENHKDIFGKENDRATVNPNRSKKGNEGVRKRNAKRRAEKEKIQSENNK